MDNLNEMQKALHELVSIPSVAGEDVTGTAPYGQGPQQALHAALNLCETMGLRVTNRDNIIGWAECGEGDEMVGILAHLDVVPAGEGWDYNPWAVTEKDGRLYGRGVIDDKGPAVACIFAMADLVKSGVKLNRRVRIIFGQSEECGAWDDMAYYKAHEERPVFGFTPDADFPAIHGEKGILRFTLTLPRKQSGLLLIDGGEAANVVAPRCKASFVDASGQTVKWEIKGKAAHASMPEDGDNAITAMMERLAAASISDPLVDFCHQHIGRTVHGELVGCNLEDDKSGKLTMNVGTIRTTDDAVELKLDVRVPVTHSMDAVVETIRKAAKPFGLKMDVREQTPGCYMDKNDTVLQKLLSVYRAETGDISEPFVIGGGTYARAMEHIVAFGPVFPGRELTEHQKNEYLLKKDFEKLYHIYRSAIAKLAED